MKDISTKPKCLILPPDDIFTEEFQKTLFLWELPRTSTVEPSEYHHLVMWHSILRTALANRGVTDFLVSYNEENFKQAQVFCNNVKGLIRSKNGKKINKVNKVLLFLEDLDYLPGNLVDTPFLTSLREKYNYTNNLVKRFNYRNYVLLYFSEGCDWGYN